MSQAQPLLRDVEMSEDPFSKPATVAVKHHFQIHYEIVFWVIFLGLTAFAIADRFTSNFFPMTINFKPLSETLVANNINVAGTVFFFDILGRASGRLFLTVFNALFWTQCKSTENFLMVSKLHEQAVRALLLSCWCAGASPVVHQHGRYPHDSQQDPLRSR